MSYLSTPLFCRASLVEPGRDHGDAQLFSDGVVVDGAENDGRVVGREAADGVHHLLGLAQFEARSVGGDVHHDTARTSWKSTLMRPGTLMISEIPATAFFSTLSAAENASSIDTSSPSTSSSFSFRITITESTCRDSSSMPISWATSATTGAAPVPVPPPIPAVMNAMCAPRSASAIWSRA